jgi:deazaflavin-dependent oxidoreductase (nitroreductase family)
MDKHTFRRWMYRGQRPNWLARALNRMTAVLGAWGVGAKYGMATLEVTGRRSGRTVSLPVAIAEVDGQRYLVSMLGENVQWVKNVRAAGGRAVIRSRGREEVHLDEVAVEERAPILKAYLRRAPGARPHVPVSQDAPLADFARIAGEYPVFRLASPQPGGADRAREHPQSSPTMS